MMEGEGIMNRPNDKKHYSYTKPSGLVWNQFGKDLYAEFNDNVNFSFRLKCAAEVE